MTKKKSPFKNLYQVELSLRALDTSITTFIMEFEADCEISLMKMMARDRNWILAGLGIQLHERASTGMRCQVLSCRTKKKS